MIFRDLKIGETFTEKRAASFPYKDDAIMVYKKVNATSARCIDQTGYGNDRGIGGLYSFAWCKLVS
jgi:hypothetical protein